MIILPRQARDKHRKTTLKKMPFLADWELAPRSFAMPGASEAKKSTAKDWAAGAAALGREDYHGDQEEGGSEEEGESSDEEAELEQLMQVRARKRARNFHVSGVLKPMGFFYQDRLGTNVRE
jgi:hypothetical protein